MSKTLPKFVALSLTLGLLCASIGTPYSALARHESSSSSSSYKDSLKEAEKSDESPAPCVSWVDPLNTPHAVLLCIHGLGLNSDAYRNFGRRLSHRGISVYAIDVRGFGSWTNSGGSKKIDFDGTVRDIKNTLDTIHKINPDLPVFLLGESMGGAIAIRAASLYPDSIEGLISAVPAGDRFGGKKEDLKVALETLGHGFRKQFDIGKSIVGQATQNKVQQEVWESDPLNRMDLSPLQLMQFQHFMDENVPAAKKISALPVLIVQGSLDKLVRPEGSWDIFNAVASRDKTFLAFPSEHLIFEYGGTKTVAEARKSAQIAAVWIYEHLAQKDKEPLTFAAMRTIFNPSLNQNNDSETEDEAERARAASTAAIAGNSTGSAASNSNSTNMSAITTGTASDAMHAAETLFESAKYDQSITALQAIIAAEPQNADAHIWLGLAYERTKQPALAMAEALQARRLGRSVRQAVRANQALTQIAADPASRTVADTNAIKAPELTNNQPTVLIFGAPWCAESSQDDSLIAHGKKYFGDRIQFKKYDIDESSSADVVKQFGVGPIPTYIFLNSDGSIKSTQLGQGNFANFVLSLQGLIH